MTLRDSRLPAAALIAAAMLLLSACDGGSAAKDTAAKETEAAPAGGSAARPAPSPAAEPKAGVPAASSQAAAPDLAAYVGKYPFDKVDGVAFNDHPRVKAGIAATVKDARVRTAITTTPGPSAPIETVNGKIASWSCQQHKCGEHQWMILIDPATGATDVCYMNDPAMVNESRWFLAGGKEEKRDTDCSAEKS
ncbi:hypothetical protein [Sphingopyxis panaciterrae]